MSAYYGDADCEGDFYYDRVYCGGEYFNHENYIREYCTDDQEYCDQPYWDQGHHEQDYCGQETCEAYRQEHCDEVNYDQGEYHPEPCRQETYEQEEHIQEDFEHEHRDPDYECLTDFIEEEDLLDEPCTSSKDRKPAPKPQTYIYAVIYELHGLYAESEHKVQGMYSSLEKANATARRCFKKNCPDYVSDLRKVRSFSAMGSGAEWMTDANGAIEIRTFSEGGDGWRTVIRVTDRTLN